MSLNLSGKQLAILKGLREFARENGYMPSIRELAREMDLSYATIRQYLDALKTRGWLSSDGTAHGLKFQRGKEDLLDNMDNTVQEVGVRVPVTGVIAAGQPLEAIELEGSAIVVPQAMAKPGAYALRVRGQSMVEDHILDGDFVVVAPQARVDDGEIAVILLEDDTATLKRLYREKGRFRLQPANATMKPFYVKKLKVRGRVTGLFRTL